MTNALFNDIFDREILPFINEIADNNSKIKIKDINKCKKDIFIEYNKLNEQYKKAVFPADNECLLDRHKVAACICGAFLRISVFDKQPLIDYIVSTKNKVESYFYYVNELVALYAASRYLAFFMCYYADDETYLRIYEYFPQMPEITLIKKGFWNCVLFNLSQVKDDTQIGLDHFDLYSYAMFFFFLEQSF